MPGKTKTMNAAIAARTAELPQIPKELLDQFVAQGSPMTRKIIKTRGYSPSDDAATKLILLALRNITAD